MGLYTDMGNPQKAQEYRQKAAELENNSKKNTPL
jgi:hypothetical protein